MTHASLYKVSTTIGVQLTLSYHQHWCQLKCRQIEFEVKIIIFLQMKKATLPVNSLSLLALFRPAKFGFCSSTWAFVTQEL